MDYRKDCRKEIQMVARRDIEMDLLTVGELVILKAV